MNKKVLLGIIIAKFILFSFAANCFAAMDQEAPVQDSINLGTIVITSSRTNENLSEISSTVNVIDTEDIETSTAKCVPDLLKTVAGVDTYDSSGAGTAGRINMRGFWGSMSTHQMVLVNGIPQNSLQDKLVDWNSIPLDNIEKIEVVKGAGQALYGVDSMSGVINIITKDPEFTNKNKVEVSYGTFDTQNYKISTSGYLDKISYLFGASRKLTKGFRSNCDYNDFHLTGDIEFSIDYMQSLKLGLGYHENKAGAEAWALTEAQIAENREQERPGTKDDNSKVKKSDISLTYKREINENSELKTDFYYRFNDKENFYTRSASQATTKEQIKDENTYGLIFQYQKDLEVLNKENSIIAGFDSEKNYFDYKEYAAPFLQRGAVSKDYDAKRTKQGIYVQDEIKIIDSVKFKTGVRYDSIRFDFTDDMDNSNSKINDISEFIPWSELIYMYKDESSVYANYAELFRSPSLGQMFTYGSFSNSNLQAEKADSYELGVRHKFNEFLKTNCALYYIKLNNEIWYDYDASKYENYGKTSHKGIETNFDFKIIKNITGFLNYTYTRAKNKSSAYYNKYLPSIPLHKANLGLNFDTDLGFKTALILRRVGSSYLDSNNTDKLAAYTTLDLKFLYSYKLWLLSLGIDNVFNKKYNSYGYKKSNGTKYFNPAAGRTITCSVKTEF
jgi:iron complex outermembrane recepter protein